PGNMLPTLTIEAEDMPIKTTGVPITGGWNIWGNGYIAEDIDFSAGGTFSFEVMAKGSYAGGAWPIMEVRIDQTLVEKITVDSSSWMAYTSQANITPGTHEVAIAFINDYFKNPDDRNLYVDKVTITTENSPPTADAGDYQPVEEGEVVVLDGFNSSDPDDNITGYSWEQTGGVEVNLTNPDQPEATFTAPVVGTEAEILTFKLTVIDEEGLQSTDTCSVQVTKAVSEDSDGDGVPDNEDAFPYDPDEWLDTDGDGEGNNADTDDDGDGMPDTWELKYGLDPLKDDADSDSDGDGVSNIDEYNLGTKPNKDEGNFDPHPPLLIAPDDDETVSLTPELRTDEFYDPNYNDVHSLTRWKIIRAEDENTVFDVKTDSSLTTMTVPKLILEYDTEYIWRVKFIDNHGGASDWSEPGYFTTEFSEADSDGNGILDHQEVDDTLDLDNDGVPDREQSDIKCIVADSGNAQIGISIRDAENVDSILSLEIEETENADLVSNSKGKPRFIDFGLLHFKLLLNAPGEETVVTIHLSDVPFGKGKNHKNIKMYKYDSVNAEWLDYSDYAEFSPNRKKVYLTLKDGGFGDADGIENGIIVDPLAFGSDSDSNSDSSSGSGSDDSLIPDNMSCFIAVAASDPGNMQPLCKWREIGTHELLIVFCLMVLGCVGTEIFLRFRQKREDGDKSLGRIAL
ncbi:MAG: carbohydrate-binding domain-containing protein, partial [Desulfobacterales bacterium]